MKKLAIFITTLLLLVCPVQVFAAEDTTIVQTIETTEKAEKPKKESSTEEKKETENKPAPEKEEQEIQLPPEDNSQPRLMVTGFTVEGDTLSPDKATVITVALKNMHKKKDVTNIKLSIFSETDEIRSEGMGTAYVEEIKAGKTYYWSITLTPIHTAAIGEHKLNFSCEYECENGGSYSASDILRVQVTQSAKLKYSSEFLPAKVILGETYTVNVKLMNTGKAPIYNCTVDFVADGINDGGTSFTGEIPSGESSDVSANLKITAEKPGEIQGKLLISYEDSFGKAYEATEDFKTISAEKVVKSTATQEEEAPKNGLWWLFMLLGALIGGALGFFIPYAIRSNKQRKEDEKRL